jgi:flavin reductase (DIM6/NTAB) family NADH-FMN oxidoreductase RutF
MYKSFDPKDLPTPQLHEYLLATIAPRPIAWASTVDKNGRVNLAPFSFFNVFGSNPPILIFSPSRRVKDNTTKHTLRNVQETGECVINIANYELAGQMVLSSGEYSDEINEFELAGLETEASVKVKAPRVKGAPAHFECKVREIIPMGEHGGAANLIICEVIHLHLNENVFNEEGKVDPYKVDNVARLGRIWYTRAREGLYQMGAPRGDQSHMGYGRLPESLLKSRYLTGNELAMLAGTSYMPTEEEIKMVKESTGMQEIYEKYAAHPEELQSKVHNLAKTLIHDNKIEEAWRVLLSI